MGISLFIVVFFLSVLLHFSIQKIFIYFKKFDDFNARSSHDVIATRTGGIGIFLTTFSVSIYYYLNSTDLFDYSLFIALGIMFIVGVYDDFYNADFRLKFLMQIIVAKILIDQGYVISNFYGLFGFYELPWLLAQSITVFIFLIIINAINFIDGIDGLAMTEFIKTVFCLEVLFDNNFDLTGLGLITIVSLLPLYYFNFKKKRKIFLGDSGSLFLGTIVSIYGINCLSGQSIPSINFEFHEIILFILVVLFPMLDFFRVILIRLINKTSPFKADQRHIHHYFIKKGMSHIKSLLIIQAIFNIPLILYLVYIIL